MADTDPPFLEFLLGSVLIAPLFMAPMILFEALADRLKKRWRFFRDREYVSRSFLVLIFIPAIFFPAMVIGSRWLEPSGYVFAATVSAFFAKDIYGYGKRKMQSWRRNRH